MKEAMFDRNLEDCNAWHCNGNVDGCEKFYGFVEFDDFCSCGEEREDKEKETEK